ncbi:MAG: ABC transporter ATP-binding protein [Candidatus Acidiferrum sp.]
MSAVIVTDKLCKSFRGKRVVDELSIIVPQGAIYAWLGDNGAGKSTTIRMLTGLLPPDAGSASIRDVDCWSGATQLRHNVGYVPEKPKLYDWMTVAETGWFAAGFHKPGYLPRYEECVARFRLTPDAKLKTLSKGGYAKVGLALALAGDPEVLILDEPTSGLDLFTRREFLGSMVDMAGAGKTILISSHGVAEIERVASHAAFIANGKLVMAGNVEELRKRILRVRLRCTETPPDANHFGKVLDRTTAGPQWQAILQDPDRIALDSLVHRAGIYDYEEAQLNLEEMYTALFGRLHETLPAERASQNGEARAEPVAQAAEGLP